MQVSEAVEAEEAAKLKAAGVRVKVDERFELKPGNKFYEWERKGIPLRIEAGPRDAEAGKVGVARRTGGDKFDVPLDDALFNARPFAHPRRPRVGRAPVQLQPTSRFPAYGCSTSDRTFLRSTTLQLLRSASS